MSRSITSSSRANVRSPRTEPSYRTCPLCGSDGIKLGYEEITVRGRSGDEVRVRVRRWACPGCGERFLTEQSRREIDAAAGLEVPRQ
jgi:YgiT-type zinc finger domain-containing protein